MDEGITPTKYNTSALPTLNSNLLKSLSSVHLPPPTSSRGVSTRTSSSKLFCYTPESSQGKKQLQHTPADYSPRLGEANLSMYTPPSSQQRFISTTTKQQGKAQQLFLTPTVPQSLRYSNDKEGVSLYSPDLKTSTKPPQPSFGVKKSESEGPSTDSTTEFQIPKPDELPEIVDEGVKPPFSYAQLIGMAILRSPNRKLTLSQIYEWINTTFKWYSQQKSGWQNSIRHNLSLNKAFKKQERPKEDPGKGNYWMIEPGMEQQFLKGGISKKPSQPQETRFSRDAVLRVENKTIQGTSSNTSGAPPSQFMSVISPFKAPPSQNTANPRGSSMPIPTSHPLYYGNEQGTDLNQFSQTFAQSHFSLPHGMETHEFMLKSNLQSPLRLKKPDDSTDDEDEVEEKYASNTTEHATDAVLLQTPRRQGSLPDQLRTPEKTVSGRRKGSDSESQIRSTALGRSMSEQSYPFATPVRKSLGLDSLKHFSSTSLSLDSPTRGKHSLDDLDMYPVTHSAKRRLLNNGQATHTFGGVSLGTLKLGDAHQSSSMMHPPSWPSGTSFGYSSMTEFSLGRYGNSPVRGAGSNNTLSVTGSATLHSALSPVRNGGLTLAPLTPATTLAPPVSILPSFTSPRFRSPLHKSLSGSPRGSLVGSSVSSRDLNDLAVSPSSRRVRELLDEDDHVFRACFGSPGKRAARSQQINDHSVLFEHTGDHVDMFGVDVCQVVRRAVENGGTDGDKTVSPKPSSWDSIDFRRMIIEEGIRLDSPIKTQDGYRIGLSPSRIRR